MDEKRDEQLWQKAKKRADFQRSLAAYFVVNAFLWLIWWFTAGRRGYNREAPWPIGSMLGLGYRPAFSIPECLWRFKK